LPFLIQTQEAVLRTPESRSMRAYWVRTSAEATAISFRSHQKPEFGVKDVAVRMPIDGADGFVEGGTWAISRPDALGEQPVHLGGSRPWTPARR